MTEFAAVFGVLIATTGAINLAVKFGTSYIDEAARNVSRHRERPIVLPPPELKAESRSSLS